MEKGALLKTSPSLNQSSPTFTFSILILYYLNEMRNRWKKLIKKSYQRRRMKREIGSERVLITSKVFLTFFFFCIEVFILKSQRESHLFKLFFFFIERNYNYNISFILYNLHLRKINLPMFIRFVVKILFYSLLRS